MAGGRDRHLGADSSIFQQHAGPNSRVAGHKAPVATDLSGMQQRAGVQVGEDAEECSTHLEDLWADDLVGAGGAAPLCPDAPPTAALWPCCRHQRGQISGGVWGVWVGECLERVREDCAWKDPATWEKGGGPLASPLLDCAAPGLQKRAGGLSLGGLSEITPP